MGSVSPNHVAENGGEWIPHRTIRAVLVEDGGRPWKATSTFPSELPPHFELTSSTLECPFGTLITETAFCICHCWSYLKFLTLNVLDAGYHLSTSKWRILHLPRGFRLVGYEVGAGAGICTFTKHLELTLMQAASTENHCTRLLWHHPLWVHSFIPQVFTECVLGAWHSGRCWAYTDEQGRQAHCPLC